jgi:hypothetical protein
MIGHAAVLYIFDRTSKCRDLPGPRVLTRLIFYRGQSGPHGTVLSVSASMNRIAQTTSPLDCTASGHSQESDNGDRVK